MSKSDRLFALTQHLQDTHVHRAEDLAAQMNVSVRTIYRDIEALQRAGVPVSGTRGTGYHMHAVNTLPPLALPDDEATALFLGLAIVAEAEDAALADAARRLSERLETALPAEVAPLSQDWKPAFSPLAQSARILAHLPTLRRAITAHQKLRLYLVDDAEPRIIHPYATQNAGALWTLRAWCETQGQECIFRLDLIERADALPELFAL